jgi:hypothetical protein
MGQPAKKTQWNKVKGFTKWLAKESPKLTNEELIAEIANRYRLVVTRSMAQNLRVRYGEQQTADTITRAHQQSRAVRWGAKAQGKDDTPAITPVEKMDRDMLQQQLRRVTARQTFYEVVGDRIVAATRGLAKLPPMRPPKIQIKKGLSEEEVVLVISDVQAGLTTSAKESGGLGEFNTSILLGEIEYLLVSLVSIMKYHPNIKKLSVFFNGDIVEGEDIFGGQLREIDQNLVEQIMFVVEHFARFLLVLSGIFEEVACTGVVGNHGRIGRKGEHSPMANFDYLCYRWLAERLSSVKNLKWTIPETWWLITNVQGWGFLQVHGDDTGSSYGGIPLYGMIRHKARYREMLRTAKHITVPNGTPTDFDYMVLGHHSVAAQLQNIISAGSWPGGTEFSLKRMQMGDIPTAPFFAVNRKHGLTWRRDIQLRPIVSRQ